MKRAGASGSVLKRVKRKRGQPVSFRLPFWRWRPQHADGLKKPQGGAKSITEYELRNTFS